MAAPVNEMENHSVGNLQGPGHVASLHLHPQQGGTPLTSVDEIEVIEAKGIVGEPRYFGRANPETQEPNKRQLTLIEREQIADHAAALGLESIAPGAVRSNIETVGIDLVALVGKRVEIGEALLLIYKPRDPCAKMDAVCQGLRDRMMNNRQGVLAQVLRSGKIRVGDSICVCKQDGLRAQAARFK
jgi:MOSC domain-containing protein YiiM